MTDLSCARARLPRLPLRKIVAVTLLLKGARLLLWSSNAGHHSAAVVRGAARCVIAFAERIAGEVKPEGAPIASNVTMP